MKNGATLVVWAVSTVVITVLCVRIKPPDMPVEWIAVVAAGAAMLPAALVAYLWPGKKGRTAK